jgi:hypothetical protein
MMIVAGAIIVLLLAFWVGAAVRFVGAIFSVRIRAQIATYPLLHGLWLFAALLLAAAALWSGQTNHPPSPDIASKEVAKHLEVAISEAVQGLQPRRFRRDSLYTDCI